MTQADIDRLLAERSLTREQFDDAQVAAFWAKAITSYADARVPALSSDAAFQLAYLAALQASFAVLAAHGLRVKSTANHYRTLYALQKLDGTLAEHGRRFDDLRQARHESVYEPYADAEAMAVHLAEALSLLAEALPDLRDSILAIRPALKGSLAAIRG